MNFQFNNLTVNILKWMEPEEQILIMRTKKCRIKKSLQFYQKVQKNEIRKRIKKQKIKMNRSKIQSNKHPCRPEAVAVKVLREEVNLLSMHKV